MKWKGLTCWWRIKGWNISGTERLSFYPTDETCSSEDVCAGYQAFIPCWETEHTGTVLTDFLNELALIYEFAFLRGWCSSRRPPGLITGDAFSICINCLGCFLISAAWPGSALWGEGRTWKSFLSDERGLQQKAKIILNVIKENKHCLSVWDESLWLRSQPGREGQRSGKERREEPWLAVCSLPVWVSPLPSAASVWSALWSEVCIYRRSPHAPHVALSLSHHLAGPEPGLRGAGAGGLSKLSGLYWYIGALRMFTAANWRLNLNILGRTNSRAIAF